MRSLTLIALLTALASGASAQRMFSSSPHFAAPHTAAQSSPSAGPVAFRGRRAYRSNFLYPYALFSDSLYSDYSGDADPAGYRVAASPPLIILQNPRAPAPMPERPPVPTEPLMIE